jgi:alanine dehydrogenase
MTLILTNKDVQALVTMDDCIGAMDGAFRALGEKKAINAQPFRVFTPVDASKVQADGSNFNYTYTNLVGAIEPLGVTCERLISHVTYFYSSGGQMRVGKAALSRNSTYVDLMILWSAKTAEPLAFIHNGVSQRMRVAAGSAIGTRYLARPDASTLALLGTGWQAMTQIEAHSLVRELKEIRVYSPNAERRRKFVEHWQGRLPAQVRECSSAREAVRGAHIVAGASNAVEPIVYRDWLEPGMFFTGVKDVEFDMDAYRGADRLFMTRPGPFFDRYIVGDQQLMEEEGEAASMDLPLLGDVVAGKLPGRTSPDEVTGLINKGDGVQFAAVAELIYRRAAERGVGYEVPTELFLQGTEYLFVQSDSKRSASA